MYQRFFTLFFIVIITATKTQSQNSVSNLKAANTLYETKDSIFKNGYLLIFINKDSAFSSRTRQKMIDAFFSTYPRLAERFNKKSARKVSFVIDPEYKGVAGTANDIVTYSASWMRTRPDDIDVVTHEAMHIVQAYPNGNGPGWITEGIADYVRYKYGVDNAAAGWSLTPLAADHSYKSSYRITARFFVWLENHIRPTIVNELDSAMRLSTYSNDIWKKLTGKTVDELWESYSKNPGL